MTAIPSYLQKGDTIGIVCPSGYMQYEKMTTCIKTLTQWGYVVKKGQTLQSKSKNYFSGTDAERLQDLQQMLDDKSVKAILFARGGYGLSRIIDDIDFKHFKKNPKWLLGYSDITVLHSHLFAKLKTASVHCSMAAAFNDGAANSPYIQSIKKVLSGQKIKYVIAADPFNRAGTAKGELVGGNLSLLAHLTGTVSSIDTKNKILFIEDIGEYLYHIDRMMVQLKRSGALKGLAGLIVGKFSEMKDTTLPFGQQLYELIFDKVKEYNYPVCFNFPVGHVAENYPLKVGCKYKLVITSRKVQFDEIT